MGRTGVNILMEFTELTLIVKNPAEGKAFGAMEGLAKVR